MSISPPSLIIDDLLLREGRLQNPGPCQSVKVSMATQVSHPPKSFHCDQHEIALTHLVLHHQMDMSYYYQLTQKLKKRETRTLAMIADRNLVVSLLFGIF